MTPGSVHPFRPSNDTNGLADALASADETPGRYVVRNGRGQWWGGSDWMEGPTAARVFHSQRAAIRCAFTRNAMVFRRDRHGETPWFDYRETP